MHIDITNRSTVLSNAAVEAALPAFAHYGSLVASAWNLRTPSLAFVSTPDPSHWQIAILDDADQAGALGYHDFTAGGKPVAKIFARTDLQNGASWTVTLTHELAEMQCDPYINGLLQTSNTRFYALEVGDPVESDSLGFHYTDRLGQTTLLSDFVLPAWFDPAAAGPYDHARHCTLPLQVLAGGYAQYVESTSGWQQINRDGQRVAMDPDDQRLRSRW